MGITRPRKRVGKHIKNKFLNANKIKKKINKNHYLIGGIDFTEISKVKRLGRGINIHILNTEEFIFYQCRLVIQKSSISKE